MNTQLVNFTKKMAGGLRRRWGVLVRPFYCPVCRSGVQSFTPLSAFYAENALKYGFPYSVKDAELCNANAYSCPACGAADRDRFCALYLLSYFQRERRRPIRMLDIAPRSPLSDFVRRQIVANKLSCEYRTADLNMGGVDDKVDIMNMSIYSDNTFDFVLCSHVLEHVDDDRKAMREMWRILRSGGEGILLVPIVLSAKCIDEEPGVTDTEERWRRFGQGDHVRLYSKHDYIDRLRAAGFEVAEWGKGDVGCEQMKLCGIEEKAVLYIVKKP